MIPRKGLTSGGNTAVGVSNYAISGEEEGQPPVVKPGGGPGPGKEGKANIRGERSRPALAAGTQPPDASMPQGTVSPGHVLEVAAPAEAEAEATRVEVLRLRTGQ